MEIKADELAQLLQLAGVDAQPEMEPMPAEEPVAVDVEMPAVTEPACDDEESAMMVMGEEAGQYTFSMEAEDGEHEITVDEEGLEDLLAYVSEPIGGGAFVDHDGRIVQATNDAAKEAVDAKFKGYMDMVADFMNEEEVEEDCGCELPDLSNGYQAKEVALDKTNDNPSGDDKNEFTMPENNPKAVKECEETKAIHESLVSKYAEFMAESEEIEEGRYYKGKKGKTADQKHGKGRKLDRNSEEFKALAAMYQKKAQASDEKKAAMMGEEEQLDELGNVHSATYSADYEEKLGDLVQELLDSGEAYTEEDAYAMAIEMLDGTVEPGIGDEIVDPDEIEAPYQMGMGMPDPYDPSGEHADSEEDHLDYLRGLAGL